MQPDDTTLVTLEGLAAGCAAADVPLYLALQEIRKAARGFDLPWGAEAVNAIVFDAYKPKPKPAEKPAEKPARAIPAPPPEEEPPDDDGLCRGLLRTDWRVRTNRTAGSVEYRRGDGPWLELSPRCRERDLMMVAVSKVSRHRGEPWRIKSTSYEWRLLVAVASRNEVDGEGTDVYKAVRAWADTVPGMSYRTLGDVLEAVNKTDEKVLQRYEVGTRAGRREKADARRALLAAGWRFTTYEGVKQWIAPGPKRSPIAAALALVRR